MFLGAGFVSLNGKRLPINSSYSSSPAGGGHGSVYFNPIQNQYLMFISLSPSIQPLFALLAWLHIRQLP